MRKLSRQDLYSLERYAGMRDEYRARAMAHKRDRRLPLGPNVMLFFEDRLTMQYQVQEILRAEKIFEDDGIEEELAAYNPLIPDGSNWKATLMIEYEDEDERRRRLSQLLGIESRVWMRVGDFDPVYPIADEDLKRQTEDKTSSVHFLRFELTPEEIEALRDGAALTAGVEHERYRCPAQSVQEATRRSLLADLDGCTPRQVSTAASE